MDTYVTGQTIKKLREKKGFTQAELAEKLAQQQKAGAGKKHSHSGNGIVVKGEENLLARISKCCSPVPGDDIIGFITRGYGVSIHRKDCVNAQAANSASQQDRWVPVAWAENDSTPFSTTLEIDSNDRSGLWLDVASVLNAAKVKVTELAGREMPAGKARILATFEVKDVEELESIRGRIRQISGVVEVRRGQN